MNVIEATLAVFLLLVILGITFFIYKVYSGVSYATSTISGAIGSVTGAVSGAVNNPGVPLVCPSGWQSNGAGLCAQCPSGMVWDGAATCKTSTCPAGWKDSLLYCEKPDTTGYMKSSYPWKVGDKVGDYSAAMSRCLADNPQGCTQYGLIVYANCKPGYYSDTNLHCAMACPPGLGSDIGISCAKKTSSIVGSPLTQVGVCPSGRTRKGDLCY